MRVIKILHYIIYSEWLQEASWPYYVYVSILCLQSVEVDFSKRIFFVFNVCKNETCLERSLLALYFAEHVLAIPLSTKVLD